MKSGYSNKVWPRSRQAFSFANAALSRRVVNGPRVSKLK